MLGKNLFGVIAVLFGLLLSTTAKAESYGGLYLTGAGSAQALSTTAAKFTAFTTAMVSSTLHGDQSVVSNVASDNVSVIGGGVYLIRFGIWECSWGRSRTWPVTTRRPQDGLLQILRTMTRTTAIGKS